MAEAVLYHFDVLSCHPPPQPFESFTSYLMRLAAANGIKTRAVLSKLLFPDASVSNMRKLLSDYSPPSFQALPDAGLAPVEKLLGTTFFHLAKKFGRSPDSASLALFLENTLTPRLRYCPYCLLENSTPYYSLLWRFNVVNACSTHGSYLLDSCGQCGKSLPLFTLSSEIPFCPMCKGDLRTCIAPMIPQEERQRINTSSSDLEFLLSPDSCEENSHIAAELGKRLVFLRHSKQLYAYQLAQIIQESGAFIYAVEHAITEHGRKFITYWKYVQHMNISMRDLFSDALFEGMPQDHQEMYLAKVEAAIRQLESLGKPITFSTVCDTVGVSRTTLRSYPLVERMISDHQAASFHIKTPHFLEREEELISRVREAIHHLLNQGKPLTQKNVFHLVGIDEAALSRYPRVKALFGQSIIEYYPGHKNMAQYSECDLMERVMELLKQLSDLNIPITIRGVGQRLGVSVSTLRSYRSIYELLKQYTIEYRSQKQRRRHRRDTELAGKAQEAIQQLQLHNVPVSRKVVMKMLHVREERLPLFPQLARILEPFEQNRSEEGRSDEELAALVPLAAQELQSLGKKVSASSICHIIGISRESLKRYPSTKVQVDQSILGDTSQRIQRREDVLIEQVETAIQTLQALQEPVSYRTISEQVGLSRGTLQRYGRVRDVIDRSIEEDKTHRRQEGLYRQEEALFKRVQAAIARLRSLSMTVTQQAVCREIGVTPKCLGRYPRVRALLEQEAIERSSVRVRQKQQKEEELAEQAQEVMQQLSAQGRPVTQKAVAESLGISSKRMKDIMKRFASDRKRDLDRKRQQREELLVKRVQVAIQELNRQGKKVTLTAISQVVGLSLTTLQGYAKVHQILVAVKERNHLSKETQAIPH